MLRSLGVVQQFRDLALRRTADARQNSSKYAIKAFNVTPGKQILAEKPCDFQAFAVFGDFAPKLETRCASRAHAEACGKIRHRNFRHGMILQSKAYVEQRGVSCLRWLAEAVHQRDERDGVGKRVNRYLMSCSQMIRS